MKKKVTKEPQKTLSTAGSAMKIEVPARVISINVPKIVEKASSDSDIVGEIEYVIGDKLETLFRKDVKKISNDIFEGMKSEFEKAIQEAAVAHARKLIKKIPTTMYIGLGDLDSGY